MSNVLFYQDGIEKPKLIADPGLGWIKDNLKGASFIKGTAVSGLLISVTGFYPDIEYESDIALKVLGIWETSWKPVCNSCKEELVGWEERVGFCTECAVDILNNMDEREPEAKAAEPEDAMFEGHPAIAKPGLEAKNPADVGYWLCPCGEVNVGSLDICPNCETPLINGVEVKLNAVDPVY